MKLVFYSIVLNHHQAPLADEFYKLLGEDYCFVELVNREGHNKGSLTDYSSRPYLIRAWESDESYTKAMELAKTAEVCVFSGLPSLPFLKERMKLGLLSFDMSERWLKQGLKNVFSPAISKQFLAYWLGRWNKKPLYKLCMSAYAAGDHYRLGMYKGKCFKWGYFTDVPSEVLDFRFQVSCGSSIRILWVGRFIDWKHPEMAVELSKRLLVNGYRLMLDMYGDGPLRVNMEDLAKSLGLTVYSYRDGQELSPFRGSGEEAYIKFHGNVPNEEIHCAMRNSDIFLFTSDKQEGWGAVANEAMSEGSLLIGSDEIGAVPYLVRNRENGLIFKSGDLEDLYSKVVWAIEHPEERKQIALEGQRTMQEVWSPQNAAQSLLQLIKDLKANKETSIEEGLSSKA